MTRFAHMSDNHLGYRQYHLKAREEDFYDAFREAIDRIIEKDVDFLIHSGDLVNRYRSHPKPIKIAADQFKRLKNHGIPTYIVPGNHDIALKSDALPVQSVLSDLTYTLLGKGKRAYTIHDDIFIGGIRYLPSTYSKSLKKRINHLSKEAEAYEKRILILHQGIRRFFQFDYQLTWNDLPRGVFDYIAMGHVHKRIQKEIRGGLLAYPGSTEIWKRDEVSSYQDRGKGLYIVDLEENPPSLEKIDLTSIRPFLQIEVEKENLSSKLEEIKRKTRGKEKRPLVFLTLKGIEGRHKVEYYNKQVEKKLGKTTLKYEIELEFEEKARDLSLEEKENREEIIAGYFEREREADFASELLETLINEGVKASKEKAENFLKEQRGGGNRAT